MESCAQSKMKKLAVYCLNLFLPLFIICLIPVNSKANVTFDYQASYQEGVGSSGVLLRDFNGDNIADMAITNNYFHSVSVFPGNGDGSFQAPTDYASGNNPWTIFAEDFNGDDKLDIVTTNGDNTFTLLAGNGDGTFLPGTTGGNTGAGPVSIASADFNGDGKLDIVTANSETYGEPGNPPVSLFLGNGDGTFTTSAFPYFKDMPYSVDAADFNNDGKADLAIIYPYALPAAAEIAVFLGNGDGTFNLAFLHEGGYSLYGDALTVTDIDHDGNEDMVTIPVFGTGTVLFGDGNGNFTPTLWTTDSNKVFNSMVVSDFNCDGKQDMALSGIDYTDNIRRLYIYSGDGYGGFIPESEYITPLNEFFINDHASIDAGDMDGDKINDIAVLNLRGDRVNVYLNTVSPSVGLCSVTPDIKANGSDGPLVINNGEMLNVKISLEPGSKSGYEADWWIYAESTIGTYWYKNGSGWLTSAAPSYQGPLASLSNFNVLNMSTLPAGNYDFYFQVDERNDIKEGARTDAVKVTIQ